MGHAERGETQQELADALDVRRETVKFWESGDRQIKGADIVKLAKLFEGFGCEILTYDPFLPAEAAEAAAYAAGAEAAEEVSAAAAHPADGEQPTIPHRCFDNRKLH